MPLIEVKNLKTYFYTEDGVVRAVDGVDFTIEQEKTLGVVGESGCGKSVTALSVMGLIQIPPGKIEKGETVEEATRREIWEETGIKELTVGPIVWRGTFNMRLTSIILLFYP